jgi:starch-binding outer membrane protein SusE/F
MKNIFKYLFPALTVVIVLASCKKEENQIFFEGGTAPVLTASSSSAMVLTPANAANQAVKFSWTNPNYAFTTGVSSQNVTYVLQVDTTGANFTSPTKQEISISNDLQITYTVKELNQIFAKMNLQENIPHNIEYRVKASLVNGSVPLYSNVIKTTVTPYLDVAVPLPPSGQLYITGNAMASDWTNNPPVSQRFTKLSNTEFTITVPFTPGKQYKFLSTLNQWQPQYGGKDANGGDMGYNMGLPGQSDPDAIPTPDVAGNYKITVNFKTGKYTVVKQ